MGTRDAVLEVPYICSAFFDNSYVILVRLKACSHLHRISKRRKTNQRRKEKVGRNGEEKKAKQKNC